MIQMLNIHYLDVYTLEPARSFNKEESRFERRRENE